MYQRVITPSAKKSLKRLPHAAQVEVLHSPESLSDHPYAGEQLHGSLNFLFSLHFKFHTVHYRVAYAIDHERKLIIIHLVGPRENFYDRLRRLF